MPSVGKGAYEIRIHTENEYRVFYVAKFQKAIYILHAFAKKARKTAQADIALGKARYGDVLRKEGIK